MNIQGWFPLGFIGLISLLPKGISRVFTSTTFWKHRFFSAQSSLTRVQTRSPLHRKFGVLAIEPLREVPMWTLSSPSELNPHPLQWKLNVLMSWTAREVPNSVHFLMVMDNFSYLITLFSRKKKNKFSRIALYFGEGNGIPLQYSRLENPMVGRAW